jgi:dipeptide/tripeptide permease
MSESTLEQPKKLSWRFPRTFWFANGAELCERAAFYGMFITLVRYLNQDIGFTDVETGWITGAFASILYFLPTFMGIMADKIGFKQALMLAFTLLTGGYWLLGAFQLKVTALLALTLIMFGGAIIKPVISGTVAKTSDDDHRARAMSIFYMVVNIGAFSGKGLAAPLNEYLGLQYINFYAAGMAFAALILVTVFYKNVDTEGVGKTFGEALRGLGKVMLHFRFLALILIIAGFWAIQGQLYGAMPTYIERVLGVGYKPEWLANINPLTVVIFVVLITHLVRKFKPENAIGIGLFIIPFTALVIALSPGLQSWVGNSIDVPDIRLPTVAFWAIVAAVTVALAFLLRIAIRHDLGVAVTTLLLVEIGIVVALLATGKVSLGESEVNLGGFGLHPLILLVIIGISLQGFAECFLSPKFLEYASKQAPKGEVGLYLGYQHLTTFFAWLFGFIMMGYLLDHYCPDPDQLKPETRHEWRLATQPEYLFTLGQPLADDLGDDVQVTPSIRAAFAEHDIELPADAVISKKEQEGLLAEDEEDEWLIEVDERTYTIKEDHLETVAEAHAAGRPEPRFDLLALTDQPRSAAEAPPLPPVYKDAHYIWYVFTAVGFAAFLALLVFKFVTNTLDMGLVLPETAKLDVRGYAITCGVFGGLAFLLLTWFVWVGGETTVGLATLLERVFRGYSLSPFGAFVGLLWGALIGLIGGTAFAGAYNVISLRVSGRRPDEGTSDA